MSEELPEDDGSCAGRMPVATESGQRPELRLEGGDEESFAKTAVQMDLILGGGEPYVDQTEKPFEFTAERLWRDRPQVAKAAIKLMAADISGRSICRRLRLSHHTLQELRYRSIEKINEQKEAMRQITFAGMGMAFDKAIELLPGTKSAKDAAVVGGILGDKYLQLAGEPTAHIKISVDYDPRAEMQRLNEMALAKFEEMKRANAEVVEAPAAEILHPPLLEGSGATRLEGANA